jgi:YD repeat-containing protein
MKVWIMAWVKQKQIIVRKGIPIIAGFFLVLTLVKAHHGGYLAKFSDQIGWSAIWAGGSDTSRPLTLRNRILGSLRAAFTTVGFGAGAAAGRLGDDALEYSPPPNDGGIPTPDANSLVGAIPGQFNVTANGAATYTIPIKVPPGTRGIEPRLSVVYNSQGGYGMLGVGWRLTGLSVIQRCGQTLPADIDPVDYDSNDRFCLDGQRLSGGPNYGADGAIYRAERETWTQVQSFGVCKGGPCYFIASAKDGTRMEYGNTADSALYGTGASDGVRLWSLNKMTDPRGNEMTVTYTAEDGQLYPDRIDYTTNSQVRSAAGALRYVKFLYKQPLEIVPRYQAGSIVKNKRILDKIQTFIKKNMGGGVYLPTQVKEYRFCYNTSPVTNKTRLGCVQECAPVNFTADGWTYSCLPSTNITWQDGTLDRVSVQNPFGPPAAKRIPLVGDFNGDGKSDVLFPDTKTVRLSNGNTFGPAQVVSGVTASVFYLGDFNADGKTDFFTVKGGIKVFLSQGDGTFSESSSFSLSFPAHDESFYLGDFNGDGRTDFLTTWSGNPAYINGSWPADAWVGYIVYLSTGTSFSPVKKVENNVGMWVTGTWPSYGEEFRMGDFNGDSRTDFLVIPKKETFNAANQPPWSGYLTYLSKGECGGMLCSTFDYTAELSNGSGAFYDQRLALGDFNGDRLTDFVASPSASPGWSLYLSTARSFVLTKQSQSGGMGSGAGGDSNGDGLADLGSYLSTGSDFYSAYIPGGQVDGDFNGDGLTDGLLVFEGHSGCNPCPGPNPDYLILSKKPFPDLVSGITDGLGGHTAITYAPLTDNTVYTKGNSGSYGDTIDVQVPMNVVSEYTVSAGVEGGGAICVDRSGAPLTYTYKYHEGKTNLKGRGWLGFAKVEVTTSGGKPTKTVTFFNQAYPETGLVSRTELYTHPGNKLLNKTTYSYNKIYNPSFSNYAVLQSVVDEYHYRGDGSSDSKRYSKEYFYDFYGNVTLFADLGDVQNFTDEMYVHTSYSNNTALWRLGYPTESKITSDATGVNLLARKQIQYDSNMNVFSEKNYDSTKALFLGATFTPNAYGNPTKITDPSAGELTIAYDEYQFAKRFTNAMGHVTEVLVDPRFGLETEKTDPNGNKMVSILDVFGCVTALRGADTTGTLVDIQKFSITKPANDGGAIYQTFGLRQWNGSSWDWKEEWRDALGRIYKTRTRGIGATAVVSERTLDEQGRVSCASQPYFEGASPEWTAYEYDHFGRARKVTYPDANMTETIFDDVASTVKLKVNAVVTTLALNARGQITGKTEDGGATTQYSYDELGRLHFISAPNGNTT